MPGKVTLRPKSNSQRDTATVFTTRSTLTVTCADGGAFRIVFLPEMSKQEKVDALLKLKAEADSLMRELEK